MRLNRLSKIFPLDISVFTRYISILMTWHSTSRNFKDGFTRIMGWTFSHYILVQYIPRIMHTVFALLCFVVVIHWLIFPYPSGLLHWHCGNLAIAPVPAKQPWWIWINTSCEFIMNDCITTTKQSTTKPCAYFLGYTVLPLKWGTWRLRILSLVLQYCWGNYSISQEICTRFCCALLFCGYAIVHNEFIWRIYPYSSWSLCWHWGNR